MDRPRTRAGRGSRPPRNRLRRLLGALWRDIPAEENGFLNNVMQAISVTDPSDGHRSTLVQWLEERAIHRHLHPDKNPIDDATINAMAALLVGE